MQALKRGFANAALELAYWSGAAEAFARSSGCLGAILRFQRVRPRHTARFQPLRSQEITPDFLDALLAAFGRWQYDVIALDAIQSRLEQPQQRRFVCLTFDGGYRDFLDHALPVLSRHAAPFALYIPGSFPDGLGELWWIALERMIAAQSRIGLVMNGVEQRFDCATTNEKRQTFKSLEAWLRSLSAVDRSIAINDLCTRYNVDLKAIGRSEVMDWGEVATVAANPLATLGSAGLNHAPLAGLERATAEREIRMGRAVLEAAIGGSARHFAYPLGDRRSFGQRDLAILEQEGFSTAVTAIPGALSASDQSRLLALPRIAWDGRRRSLRAMRVILSGLVPP